MKVTCYGKVTTHRRISDLRQFTIVGYLYRQGIEKRAMGYACAVGLVLLIIVMIVNMIQLAPTGTFKKEER